MVLQDVSSGLGLAESSCKLLIRAQIIFSLELDNTAEWQPQAKYLCRLWLYFWYYRAFLDLKANPNSHLPAGNVGNYTCAGDVAVFPYRPGHPSPLSTLVGYIQSILEPKRLTNFWQGCCGTFKWIYWIVWWLHPQFAGPKAIVIPTVYPLNYDFLNFFLITYCFTGAMLRACDMVGAVYFVEIGWWSNGIRSFFLLRMWKCELCCIIWYLTHRKYFFELSVTSHKKIALTIVSPFKGRSYICYDLDLRTAHSCRWRVEYAIFIRFLGSSTDSHRRSNDW